MLKQSAFFKHLKRKKLTVFQYDILYRLYPNPKLNQAQINAISKKVPKIYINEDCTLTEEGVKLIKKVDSFFKPMKNLKNMELLGDDYQEQIDIFLSIFPTQKLPSGKYARGNKKNIEANFMWFFQEYDYDWELILDATEKYIEEFQKKNFMYMRTAQYFIKKMIDGTATSELATYCDILLNQDDYVPERTIKSRVV